MARRKRSSRSTLPPLPSLVPDTLPDARRRTTGEGRVLKTEWSDPSDRMPSAAKTARTIYGYMAYCPLRWCLRRHGARSSFTLQHIEAADRLRLLFDGSRLGFSGIRDWRPIQAINYRPSTGPTRTAMRSLRCRTAFDQVWSIFDDMDRSLLLAVVLRNIPVGRVAEMVGQSKPRTTQRLVAVLDRLCEHFVIGEDRRAA
jgi:hypothetical protein